MHIKGMDWTTVCLALISLSEVSSLTCLTCKGISQPRHCMTVDDCYPGEICGVERLKNDFGETFYNVGCFVESKCQNTTVNLNGDCRECCRSDLCNAQGCGQSGYPQNRGPICYNCRSLTNPDLCHSISFCEQGDVCKFDVLKIFGDDVYSSTCSSVHECKLSNQQGPSIVGRELTEAQSHHKSPTSHRSVTEHVCSGCCDQDLCNKGCNGTLITKGTDFCQPNPCVHGTCVPNSSDYSCLCTHGFTGLDCGTDTSSLTDCYDIYHKNISQTSGVYNVTLWRSKQAIQVYCDMDTFPYGWTVFQKRFNGSVDFYQNFSDYTNGFGNLHGEFWLGLSFIEEMASQYETDIRLDLTAADDEHVYQIYEKFSLSHFPDFTLHVGRHTVDQIHGDMYSLNYNSGCRFSTFDHDAESDSRNCAETQRGGWWYKDCSQVNLNGQYISPPGGQSPFDGGWGGFIYFGWRQFETLKSSQIMFRKHE